MKKEAEILNKLHHENIIQFKEFLQDSLLGCYIIVTEYFESIKIKDFLKENAFKCETYKQILNQIYDGMSYLHNQMIIHRDLNMNNILINPFNLQIKIIDFGLSRLLQNNEIQEFFSPQGNFLYRCPLMENLSNAFFEDVWNFAVISLSFMLNEMMNTKKVMKLLEKFSKDPLFISKEENTHIILQVLQNSISESSQLKYDNEIKSPLNNFNAIFVK